MSKLKYKVGDRIKIKSLDFFNKNKGKLSFYVDSMALCFANEIVTIKSYGRYPNTYRIDEDEGDFLWTDEMIEGLVEEEVGLVDNLSSRWVNEFNLPDGYIFKDENNNVINATKIVLEKKKKVIPDLQLDSVRTVREYCTEHSRIWLEIYEDNPEVCIFTHLCVDEDQRRKGYGTKALAQAETIAKDLGCDTIHLKVETYSWMSKWYLRSGYKFLTNAEDNYTWLTKSI